MCLFSTGQSHTHGLGFAFRNNQVVARDCRRLVVKTIKFETYACNFVVGQKEITIYNIHSKAGASKDNILRRRNEIEALKQLIRNDSNRQPIYMIAGDMNTKDKVELEGLITQL
jgi:hypothetical protein